MLDIFPSRRRKHFFLTGNDVKVLCSFGSDDEVFIPEMAALAKLTPREAKAEIKRLKEKRLVRSSGKDYLKLTSLGSQAREYLMKNAS